MSRFTDFSEIIMNWYLVKARSIQNWIQKKTLCLVYQIGKKYWLLGEKTVFPLKKKSNLEEKKYVLINILSVDYRQILYSGFQFPFSKMEEFFLFFYAFKKKIR